jgi:hypothetical protein
MLRMKSSARYLFYMQHNKIHLSEPVEQEGRSVQDNLFRAGEIFEETYFNNEDSEEDEGYESPMALDGADAQTCRFSLGLLNPRLCF